jgi:hypothetical protein
MKERPAAEVIISTIQQFLSSCPRSPPLWDLLRPWSGQAHLVAESSLSLSRTHVAQAASDEDDQNWYMV